MQDVGVSTTYTILRIAFLVFAACVWIWVFYKVLQRSDDPVILIAKWVFTAIVITLMVLIIKPYSDEPMDFIHVITALVGGLTLTAIWRNSITALIAKPFTNLFDGGDIEADPVPFYSIAQTKCNRGKYQEAIVEIRRQLERFPTDYTGQIMLAEVQVKHLNDMRAAEMTVQHLLEQKGHAPRNIAMALNTLADWHLKYNLDPEAAREDLERIAVLLPGSEFGLAAGQRIAHLVTKKQLLESHERKPIPLPEGIKNLGLLHTPTNIAPVDIDPGVHAQQLVKHLTEHPLDTDARENLARIYADHFKRLDLATDQLDQLIEQENQPAKNVIHWLNFLADLQVRHGADYDTIRKTLERIADRYPHNPASQVALNRIELIQRELKAKDKNQDVKMGVYDQRLGLKHGPPAKPS